MRKLALLKSSVAHGCGDMHDNLTKCTCTVLEVHIPYIPHVYPVISTVRQSETVVDRRRPSSSSSWRMSGRRDSGCPNCHRLFLNFSVATYEIKGRVFVQLGVWCILCLCWFGKAMANASLVTNLHQGASHGCLIE